jgi:capsular polysaccharide biosynthesis protein
MSRLPTGRLDTTVLPACTSHRRLPLNFDERDRQLFEHEFVNPIPATSILELRDVRISPEGLLFKRGKILTESFAFPFLFDEWKKRSVVKFLIRNYSLRTRRLEQSAVWIVDDWSSGYFHWLADALSRLVLMRDHLRDKILLLPFQYQQFDYVQASLKAFAVQNVRFINANEVLRCNRLFFPTPVAPSGHFREEIIQAVRNQLVGQYGLNDGTLPEARIYISREKAPKRKIVNEPEVVEVLRSHRFEVIHAEDLSFADQVRIVSQARYLVSNHGAGLTNMLFMAAGKSVLELRHRADRINNCYFTLASALNLNYFYQTCDSIKPNEDAHTADLVVDPAELEKNLTRMLS